MNNLNELLNDFFWFNEPKAKRIDENKLYITTKKDTDFWQRTHYGFRRDDGHCLLTKNSENFSLSAKFTFFPNETYDQCGLIIRGDSENWIKVSTEYEDEKISRLGSVVTNLGYSDWATRDIPTETSSLYYRVQKRGQDFLLENSFDGINWQQMRIAHLHKEFNELEIGIYGCSPMKSNFEFIVEEIKLGKNSWEKD